MFQVILDFLTMIRFLQDGACPIISSGVAFLMPSTRSANGPVMPANFAATKAGYLRLWTARAKRTSIGSVPEAGQYQSAGQGVSISLSQLSADVYTWYFRNDSFVTVTALRFRSRYVRSESGLSAQDEVVVRVCLKPGDSIGGVDVWAVCSSTLPVLELLTVERIVHRLHQRYRG